MDTAIIITGFIGFGAGLLIGAIIWGAINAALRKEKDQAVAVIGMQVEEIDALNKNNLRLRGQCAELATQAHDANERAKQVNRQADTLAYTAQKNAADYHAEKAAHRKTEYQRRWAMGEITKIKRMIEESKNLHPDGVQWIVNDLAELGVLINDQAFFLYKGRSLEYGPEDCRRRRIMYRPVFKREFGECCHPVNYSDPTKIGTVDITDSDEWKPLPDNQTTQGYGG